MDDNVDAAEVLKVLLTSEGHTVRTAHTGASAMEAAPQFEPQVALLDIGLPDMDGYELARKLRSALGDILLIAVSGWTDERGRSRKAGFNHHLVKPVAIEDVQRLLFGDSDDATGTPA